MQQNPKMVNTAAHASTSEAVMLWDKIQDTYAKAMASGAAKGIETTEAVEAEGSLGVEVVVRIAEVLADKPTKPERTECVPSPALPVHRTHTRQSA